MNNCGRRSLIRKPIQSVLINGMCIFEVSVRKANAEISAELTSHTSPFATIATCCNRLHFGLCVPFSHTPKLHFLL